MSERNIVAFDAGELRNLRHEAELNHVDFSRAKIREAAGGGYTVVFAAPLFDLGDVLTDPPKEITARTAAIAEGELLTGLIKIQRAERIRLRTGRSFGLSNDQLTRRALTAAEVDDYVADLAHKKEVAKLQRELTAVLETNAAASAASAGADELKDRYGLAQNKPAPKPAKVSTLPSARPTKAPSRGAKA
jgi:hypothetical protein